VTTKNIVLGQIIKKRTILENIFHSLHVISEKSNSMKSEDIGNVANEERQCSVSDTLRRDLSSYKSNFSSSKADSFADSFAFLQDSLISSLLRKCDPTPSLTESFKLNTSKSFPDLRKLPTNKPDFDTDSNCFFMQSWPSQNIVNPPNQSSNISFGILDVTLPVLNPLSQKRKADCISDLISPRVPKLRRCRSLVFKNEPLLNETELALLFESFCNEQTHRNQSKALDESFSAFPSTKGDAFPITSSTPKLPIKAIERKHLCSPLAISQNMHSSPLQNSYDLFNEEISPRDDNSIVFDLCEKNSLTFQLPPSSNNYSIDMFE